MLNQMAQWSNAEFLHVKADGTVVKCRVYSCYTRYHRGKMQSFFMLSQMAQLSNAEFIHVKPEGTVVKCRVSSC
jgi:hypothetical protein